MYPPIATATNDISGNAPVDITSSTVIKFVTTATNVSVNPAQTTQVRRPPPDASKINPSAIIAAPNKNNEASVHAVYPCSSKYPTSCPAFGVPSNQSTCV